MDGESTDGYDLLRSLSRYEEVADDVAERGTVVEHHEGTAEITHTRYLNVTQSEGEETMPKSAYEAKRGRDRLRANRWGGAPSDFRRTTVDYVSKESADECTGCGGQGRNTCPTCKGSTTEECPDCSGQGIVDCEGCGGDGYNDCSNCNGNQTVTEQVERPCGQCDGRTAIDCPNCPGGDDDCRECSGDGVVDCPKCRGSGTETNSETKQCQICTGSGRETCSRCSGDTTQQCRRCEGDTTITCRECDGDGDLECSRCEGDGRTVSATVGSLSFDPTERLDSDKDHVPRNRFRKTDGETISTDRPVDGERPSTDRWSGKHRYRKEVTRSNVPYEHVRYTYDGNGYDVSLVESDVRYEDFPNDPKHLEREIRAKIGDGYFRYRSPARSSSAVVSSLKRVLVDSAKFLLASIFAFVSLAVFTAVGSLLSVESEAVLMVGTAVVVGCLVGVVHVFFEGDADDTSGSQSSLSAWDFLLPAAVGVGAGVAFVAGLGSEPTRWLFAAVAAAVWSRSVAAWLDHAGSRISFVRTRRASLLRELTTDDATLSKHGLTHLLPSVDPAIEEPFYRKAGLGVVALGWGLSASCFATAFLLLFLGDLPAQIALTFTQLLGAVAVVATLSLLTVPLQGVLD